MYFPDFDSEWDDDLPTVLQVLEGIEVEDMPDIHVEREPSIYTPTRSEIHGPNRLIGLTLILESETTAAEMQPAGHESRVVEYKPLRVYSTIPPDTIESSSSLPGSGIRCTPHREEAVVDEDLPEEFSAHVGAEAEVGTGDINAPTRTRIDAGPITNKAINTKPPRKASTEVPESHQATADEQEVARTGSVDKIPEVADSADEVQDGISQSERIYDAI
ncbi:uncharacterized protein LAJ45_03916 [Morchella importuna]|uniref:Uncharacterized protein n=1 Tax=Morchella conica CCBAS932 TaxID=1392247 RepID=A0A3N4L1F3_9PEZI|nr:uncharacterized protein LAJ45_03916 [Morchella importuna]KAH8151923.1 hypothetical protein LAJ45_03916 [Morchella importuna]RPB16640.1 hypothetical protein P167DRAFT_541973 [Morchella conica CCBAS932]